MNNAAASSSSIRLGHVNGGFRQRHAAVDVSGPEETEDRKKRDRRRKASRRGESGSKMSSRLGFGWEGRVKEGFRRFGEHCARNQASPPPSDPLQRLMIMTNLFYPALAVYLQKIFPPLHPPSPPSHNTHRIPAQGKDGPSRRVQKEHPLSLLSTPVLDSFFPYPPPLVPRLTWAGWWGRDTGQNPQEGWRATRVAATEEEAGEGGDELRIMRVGWADVGDVLDREVEAEHRAWAERDHVLLRLVRDMAEEWEVTHQVTGASCIRELVPASGESQNARQTGLCQIISPHPGPEYDHITSLAHLTTSAVNGTEALESVPIGWAPNAGNVYHSVAALFRVPRSSSMVFEDIWLEAMNGLTKEVEGEVFVEAQGSQGGAGDQTGKWLLSYTSGAALEQHNSSGGLLSDLPSSEQVSTQTPNFVFILYIFLFAVLAAQISDAHKAHSRFGLALTGIVQLVCSAVMSFSVLVLLGWNGWGSSLQAPTLPTYILPFVIVVVGVENMSTLTEAVFSVGFNYSVPVRIGLGLSKVGTTIALTSLTDLGLLGLVWVCVNLRPVREFCLFAAVVIITDWFMLHTFFLTVLSIDAQRLELADVLASDGMNQTVVAASEGVHRTVEDQKTRGSGWRKISRKRTTKSASLILMLITVGVLYYRSELQRSNTTTTAGLYGYTPTSTAIAASTAAAVRASAFVTSTSDVLRLSIPERLWRTLNPFGWPFVRIVVPGASIVVLPRPGHHMLPADIRKLSLPTSRLLLPRLKPLFYLFKVVILPQAVTATALYMLLRYLLKDSDLLDTQRDGLGRGENQIHSKNETDTSTGMPATSGSKLLTASARPHVHMLPCSHESDVDIIASSPNGQIVLSIGVDNLICLWRFGDDKAAEGTRERLLAPSLTVEDPIVAATISNDERWIAVCSVGGVGQIWELQGDGPPIAQDARQISGDHSARITAIAFEQHFMVPDDPFIDTPSLRPDFAEHPTLLVASSDGTVRHLQADGIAATDIHSRDTAARVFFLAAHPGLRILIASQSGVTLYDKIGPMLSSLDIPADLPQNDRITCISQDQRKANARSIGIIALGHRSGIVEVFDAETATFLAVIDQPHSIEGIRRVDLASPPSSRCTGCGTSSSEGFFVISSTANHVYVDRLMPRSAVHCRCSTARRSTAMDGDASKDPSPGKDLHIKASLVVPPSSGRTRLSPRNSSTRSPTLLPPVSDGNFPLSSHGTKRLGNMHREGPDQPRSPNRANAVLSLPNGSAESLDPGWDFEVHSMGAISSSGGGGVWVLMRDTLIGIRKAGGGIDDSQWQIWAVDLSMPWNGTKLLVETADLSSLVRRSVVQPVGDPDFSMRDRRSERLLSLNGRAPFPSIGGTFSIPTHPSLGYVHIRPLTRRGPLSVVAGFGNRLGVISLPEKQVSSEHVQRLAVAGTTSRTSASYAQSPPPPKRGSAVTDGMNGTLSNKIDVLNQL